MSATLPTVADLGGVCDMLERPDGARLRWAWFAPPPDRPALLILIGYAEFLEKQLDTVAMLRARDMGALIFDWRGQGRSTRACGDPQKGWIDRFETHLDDLDAVLAAAAARDPAARPPWPVLGHSMGGHLALRFAHRRPDACARLVLSAPMIDIRMALWQKALVNWFVDLMIALGQGRRYILAGGPQSDANRRFADNPLTSDPVRFAQIFAFIDRDPALAVGAPTYDWVKAARTSIALTERAGFAEAIDQPVLMVMAGDDRIVETSAAARLLARLPAGEGLILEGARHEVMLEAAALRARFWAAFDAFMGTTVKPTDCARRDR